MKKELPPDSAPAAVMPAGTESAPAVARLTVSPWSRLTGRINWLLFFTVLLPLAAAMTYFGLIASDVYISESRYVLRSPQRQAPVGLSAILQGAGFARAQDDTYTVHEYILSRDALRVLDQALGLKEHFSDPSIDLLHRFSALDGDHSFEALHRYYLRRVELTPDTLSAITTLEVRAFSPELAQAINERLLLASEALVNKLNERGRQDLIRFAEREVAGAEERAKQAMLALSEFRSRRSVFDPAKQSAIQLQLISKLQDELIVTQTQLAQVRALSAQSPQLPALELRLRTLRAAIDVENRKVVGGELSLSDTSSEYERLMLEREFADRQLGAAMASLEQARNDAMRKQLYLERVAQPSLADKAMEPRRLRGVFSVLVLGLVAWGVLSMLLAGVREHQD